MDFSNLSREECVLLLESVGIQCYDHEPTHVLREAVEVNAKDGTLDTGDPAWWPVPGED